MRLSFVLVVGLLFASLGANAGVNDILVRFAPGTSAEQIQATLSKNGYEMLEMIKPLNMVLAKPVGKSADREKLNRERQVLYAEPDGVIRLDPPIDGAVSENFDNVDALTAPNDRKYSSQWHHRNIQSELAWSVTTGSTDVVVAIIDTGIFLAHEDLKNQLWVNAGEIPGNQIDDDKNGFVDDVNGWDFINKDNVPNDDQSHGTHCAGIVGAEGNNGIGIAGVNWKVKLMAVKFLSSSGSGSYADGVSSILYAVDNGAKIISASWGSTEHSLAIDDAVKYAAEKGVLFVAAAGNSKVNNDREAHFPSSVEQKNMIAVGASTTSNGKADFSNFGKTSVDVAAPGTNIFSSVLGKNSYGSKSGTSMATPVVAGVAALILSVDPTLDVTELKNAVLNSVVQVKSWRDKSAAGGVVNAARAIERLVQGPGVWPQTMRLLQGDTFQMTAYKMPRASWAVSNAEVATITSTGVLTAVKGGEVTVTATSGSQVFSGQVYVLDRDSGGGCAKASTEVKPIAASASMLLMLLPFLFAVLTSYRVRRRQ